MTIQILTHTDCLAHDPGAGHPETPLRLAGVLSAIDSAAFIKSLVIEDAPLGTEAQILLAHHDSHLQRIKETAPEKGEAALDGDTRMSPGSLNAALRAVGATCQGVDNMMSEHTKSVFCATRPPGHHATPTHAMGFCLFNHIAIAALHAREKYNLDRVAIVDFDVHHGNGTQDIMQGREGMFYISTHQSPLYPGTGLESENIDNNIFNVPVHGGTGHATYVEIFQEMVVPALQAYQPELILVSAGFDAHKDDPLAGMALTNDTYKWLGSTLQGLANDHCGGKLLSALEGGYNLSVLPDSVLAYLEGILEV
jgi:acetoin utilization deacetylase AcuC-like enzyme